jgi:hypothetical protein
MHKTRSLTLVGLALMAVGFAASSASAAPKSTSALLLTGDSFPVKFSSLPKEPNTIFSELQSPVGSLEGEGILLQGEILKSTGGLYEVLFLNVVERGTTKKCNSLGDLSGEVLVPRGNFFLVHDISPETGGGIRFEVKSFDIECESGVLLQIQGSVVGLLLPLEIELLWTGGKVSVGCKFKANELGAGTPSEHKFWTSLSSELSAKLEANFGTGFKQSCELIGSEGFELELDVNKMITLMQ